MKQQNNKATEEAIERRRKGYSKQITPQKVIKEITQLKRKLTYLEKNIEIKEKKSWLNISKQCKFQAQYSNGSIYQILIVHLCWVVGSLYWNEFPEFRCNNSKRYKIEWDENRGVKVFWDGKGR